MNLPIVAWISACAEMPCAYAEMTALMV